jgi:uncharacterized protein (DUF58 family)
VATAQLIFPLVPRRRLIGLFFGAMHSARRGMGSDVAGSRPYRPGDDVDTIDWYATARLSSAHGTDEFVVQEHFAEEAPRVVVVCDRRPEMSLYPPGLPWLSKPEAVRAAVEVITESTLHARGFVGYLDCADEEPFWRPPRSQASFWEVREQRLVDGQFHAPADNLVRAFEHLEQVPSRVPAGSFVFVVSDFLVAPPDEVWANALERRWDVVPVVIQDPLWEQSFPDVSSIVVPLADPRTGKVSYVRLSKAEARERRRANERRRALLLENLEALGLEPILIDSNSSEEMLQAFLEWAEGRTYRWARGW